MIGYFTSWYSLQLHLFILTSWYSLQLLYITESQLTAVVFAVSSSALAVICPTPFSMTVGPTLLIVHFPGIIILHATAPTRKCSFFKLPSFANN